MNSLHRHGHGHNATHMPHSNSSGHAHHMAGSCKISMLWNWNVHNACFFVESWRITSKGMLVGSCIAVIILVILLEFIRRLVREYDRFLFKQHAAAAANKTNTSSTDSEGQGSSVNSSAVPPFRPNVPQQALRALLQMMQFAAALMVMLFAMYFNGYIIICIFIGVFIGSFIFQWEKMTGEQQTRDATICCG